MPVLSIGNRVKMLRDTIQGIVQQVGKDGVVTIETDEGFEIPVLASELVLIPHTDKPTTLVATPQTRIVKEKKGLFLAITLNSKSKAQLFIINNEDTDKLVVLNRKKKEAYYNFLGIKLEAEAFYKIPGIFTTDEIEIWNKWLFQIIPFSSEDIVARPFEKHIQIKSKKLFLSDEDLPLIGEKGMLVRIEAEAYVPVSNERPSMDFDIDKKSLQQIDIHAEALGLESTTDNLQNVQFEAFLKHFENCIAFEVSQFTVIHGTGKGILKNRIHKFLSKNENVSSFKESRKDQFGYGATDVSIS